MVLGPPLRAGAWPDKVWRSAAYFAAVNAIYARYFPQDPPARIFVCVPEWFAPFEIEIDCVAIA